MKNISILGSTGSIGVQTLNIVRAYPNKFNVVGLTANNNSDLLLKQIEEFKPDSVACMNPEKADEITEKGFSVYSGLDGIKKIAQLPKADIVVNSLVGSIGVEPTLSAIRAKKNVALANKETLVTAGAIVMDAVAKNNVTLMPIDSEHSALFQCLNGEKKEDVSRIILTASGGPFRSKNISDMKKATKKDALGHPTWKMGDKITVDSATLMNKGFEVIETHFLYGIDYSKIDVVVHPQSIIHSMIEFKDRATMAQLSYPSMELPIQYSLSYPDRLELQLDSLDLVKLKTLTFEKPDLKRFPCLQLAYDAGKVGGTRPAILNAANEIAVYSFLEGRIRFLDIPEIVKICLESQKLIKKPDLHTILAVDQKTREYAMKLTRESK